MRAIFEDGIASGKATFDRWAPSWEDWNGAHLPLRLVAEDEGDVLGWAALSSYSHRECYRGVGESRVYVAERARGHGIGRALMERLIADAEVQGYYSIHAGVFPWNEESLKLHERVGFRVVGVHERLGVLDGEWKDVVVLERRSP